MTGIRISQMLHPCEELQREKEPHLGSNLESGLDISVFAFEIVCNCYKPIAAWGVGEKKTLHFIENHWRSFASKISSEPYPSGMLQNESRAFVFKVIISGDKKEVGFRSWLFIFLCMQNLIPSFFHVTFIITAPSSLCHAFLKLVTINSHQMGVARILIINPFTSKMSSSL